MVMYKIIMFNVREEEMDLAKKWAAAHDVEVELHSESLTLDNAELVKGFDGLSVTQTSHVKEEMYPLLKTYGIKQIAQRTAGVDFYDLDLARKNGLIISNVPMYSPESIAEFAVMSTLRLIRKVDAIKEYVQDYDFRWQTPVEGRVLGEMTVGIVGTGHIGMTAAKIFKGYGCKVIGYDLYPNEANEAILTYQDSIEELVSQADIVSLHLPATKDNYHEFDKELFKHFKKEAYLINTARGQIVDTKDLLAAIDEGQLAGAALDTYEYEAPYVRRNNKEAEIHDETLMELIHSKKVCYTPHVAFYTGKAVANMMKTGLEATLEVIKTGDTKYRVN